MPRLVDRRWAAALLVAAGSVGMAGRAAAAEPKKVATVEGITEYRLDNGLRVLLYPDPSRPKVTVNLTVFVGSRHEGAGETGMAHLLEHMVFKGTPTHPDIPLVMKERGAQFNGSTWVDRTNYFETLPASDANLEFALRLEADRMVNSHVRAQDLATEFSVVRNEFEAGENSPERILSQRMTAVAYEWHNYGKSTIGNKSDIERVPVDNLRAFYRKYYQPDNAMLVIAGRFDEKKALDYVTKYFGSLPRPDRKLEATYTEEPAQDGERVVTLRRVGDVGAVGVLYHVPAGPHQDFAAVEVLSEILDAQPSGRLYKALVESKKATSVRANARPYHDPGVLEVLAEVPKGKSLDDARDTMLSVVESLGKEGVTKEETERAKQRLLKERELADADPNRVAIELSEWGAQGDWRLYFLDRDRIEKVTPEQVKEVAERYLVRSNRTVGLFIPTESPQRATIPPTPDVAKLLEGYKGRDAGSAGERFDVAPAEIQARIRRPDPIEGVKVALLPKKTTGETVSLQLTLRYGNADNLKGLVDAADFLPSLMVRGTKNLNRQQIQDRLDKNRARLNAFGGPGTAAFNVETKRAYLPSVLEVLREVLREPTLPADEFELLKAQRLTRLEQGRTQPQALAFVQLQRLLTKYPEDDVRYVPTIDEHIARIKGTTLDQVKRLYRDYLGSGHGELAIVGDFEPSEALPILARALESWKAKESYARIEEPYQPGLEPSRRAILTPDKANATYAAGLMLRLKDDDPDYAALVVGNVILGGGTLSSRLGERLRQKGGLSYGAGSMFAADAQDDSARLLMFAIFNPDNVSKVEAGAREEFERLIREGVKPDELEQAKKGYLQQQRVRRSNDGALASLLVRHLFDDRTMQYDADQEARVQGLTPDQVNAALRKHVDPKKLSVVVAGDLKSGAAEEGK
jgi:zinc protease